VGILVVMSNVYTFHPAKDALLWCMILVVGVARGTAIDVDDDDDGDTGRSGQKRKAKDDGLLFDSSDDSDDGNADGNGLKKQKAEDINNGVKTEGNAMKKIMAPMTQMKIQTQAMLPCMTMARGKQRRRGLNGTRIFVPRMAGVAGITIGRSGNMTYAAKTADSDACSNEFSCG